MHVLVLRNTAFTIGDVEPLECLGAIQKHKYNAAIGVRQIGTPEPNAEPQN
jgi:hypothetical protein